jgi:hypothetical protein
MKGLIAAAATVLVVAPSAYSVGVARVRRHNPAPTTAPLAAQPVRVPPASAPRTSHTALPIPHRDRDPPPAQTRRNRQPSQ